MRPFPEVYGLLSTTYDVHHLARMPFSFGVKCIHHAIDKDERRKAWDMWLIQYEHMDKKTFEPFEVFYHKLKTPVSTRPTRDILQDAERIRKKFNKQKGG